MQKSGILKCDLKGCDFCYKPQKFRDYLRFKIKTALLKVTAY